MNKFRLLFEKSVKKSKMMLAWGILKKIVRN